MTTPTKKTRMSDLIHYRLRVTTIDNRGFVGQLLAFDNHLNLVLADTEEFRTTKKVQREMQKTGPRDDGPPPQDKRLLGLIILRGEQVVAFSIESPPPVDARDRVGKGIDKRRPIKTPRARLLQEPARIK